MYTTAALFLLAIAMAVFTAYSLRQELRFYSVGRAWTSSMVLASGALASLFLGLGALTVQPSIDAARAQQILTAKGKPWNEQIYHEVDGYTLTGSRSTGEFVAAHVSIKVEGGPQLLPILQSTPVFWKYVNRDRWTNDLGLALKQELAKIEADKASAEADKAAEERRKNEAFQQAVDSARKAWRSNAVTAAVTN